MCLSKVSEPPPAIFGHWTIGSDIDPPHFFTVSMSVVRPESRLNHYKRLAIGLALLAAILLAVDIGLGVYCKSLMSSKTVLDL